MNQTAQGLAALGRGPDTMLVHMAPEEVAGLQALALKHGGTLTVNPETGLAEAGFLKNILPMVAGFALGPAGFGLSSAMAGLTVGGITALTSKSLEKGLMAGLGAYGGSGLGESLMGAGTGALSSAAGNTAASGVTQAVPVAATEGIGTTVAQNAASAIPAGATNAVSQTAVDAFGSTIPNPAFSPIQTTTVAPQLDFANAYSQDQAMQKAVADKLASATPMDRLGAGFNAATSSSDAALAFAKANKMPLGALGIAALSGSDDKNVPTPNDPGMIRPYTYSRTKVPGVFDRTPNDPMSSRERQYFNDQYTARTPYKAPGPEYMAEGGPVEDMSDANAIGMNTGYPQADIRTGAYATPYQQPISRNVVTGVQGAGVNPYTGQAQFADGGSVTGTVGGYTYNPRTGLYTKPGGQGATTVAPTGGLSGASGDSGGSDAPNYVNPNVAKETFEEQSARNQKLNDFLTEVLPTVLSPFSTMARGLYSTPLAGGVANFFDPLGSQPNYGIPVENAGTYAGMPPMGQTSYESGVGNPGEGGGFSQAEANNAAAQANSESGASSGDYGGYSGSTDSSGDGTGGEARGGLNLNGKYYPPQYAQGGLAALAQGGMSNLGSYSDGGRLLRGPGDGVSDSIPAMIGQKQQARLADGEFVVPARIVSELGNGSTEAGARQLYAMMDRVQKARKKTVGKDKVATNSRAAKLLPA